MSQLQSLLVINQVYPPDPAAVGQYMADVAEAMARRGWCINVLTGNRGYDDPKIKYARWENRSGIYIRRLPFSSFGKSSIFLRLLAGFIFTFQVFVYGIFIHSIDCILVSTSPPISALAAVVISKLRKVPVKYWVMDINPDQMIQLGRISQKSIFVGFFNLLNKLILKNTDSIITLDQFMAERINAKIDVSNKLSVVPLWPMQSCNKAIDHSRNPFRKKYKLEDKFVIMYSGNHGITNPLDTLLEVALRMQANDDVIFIFIGGGVKKKEVNLLIEKEKPFNIISLPYQPFDELKYSLSAADVHVISTGNEVVGVVHPSKIYGAMAASRPILSLGPDKSYISSLINNHKIGWQVNHGDIDGLVKIIKYIIKLPREELNMFGKRAHEIVNKYYSKAVLIRKVCDTIEYGTRE